MARGSSLDDRNRRNACGPSASPDDGATAVRLGVRASSGRRHPAIRSAARGTPRLAQVRSAGVLPRRSQPSTQRETDPHLISAGPADALPRAGRPPQARRAHRTDILTARRPASTATIREASVGQQDRRGLSLTSQTRRDRARPVSRAAARLVDRRA